MKRLVQALLVLLLVSLLLFIMLRIVPGNPVAVLMGEHANQETIDRVTAELGLDQPIHVQFFRYLTGAVRGDFGTSYSLGKPVSQLIGSAFLNTLLLSLAAALFAWITGGICGVLAAIRKNSIADRLFMGFSLLGISMPVFMVAMILQYVFAYWLHWVPISGTADWRSFILPAIALGWNSAGSIARLIRSALLDILEDDYIDTARAKGLSKTSVLFRHALRNTMLPTVTMMALQFSALLSGAVITETIFSINGVGRLAVQAINARDVPLLQGTVLFSTALVILGNLIADLLYKVLDPRTRKEA
ncbi:MAG: ABC transporter permease [Clostridia bacterium]|nr:ABC transporter permease [Clostridia bacterium]